ncbi:MAG: magnesium-translocating P-type ATPase [Candidatus Pacebacteria bacterium]|jgi:Mg2+-importing ATPase|nr:magnesium-translocating P-type ATPase [Candidatus Paceibacterota bacterium]
MNIHTENAAQTTGQPKEVVDLLLRLGKGVPSLALTALESSELGLTLGEVAARTQKYGKNLVAHTKPPHWWVQLVKAFITPFTLILILIGATAFITDVLLAGGDRDWTKVVLLSTMIILSGTLRFWQEFRSQKEAQKLKALIQNKALVTRKEWGDEGKDLKREINVSELVPGDIVHLSAGDMVPADLRLIASDDFFVSQSSLTGESVPVEKFAEPLTLDERAEAKKDISTNNPLDLNTLCFLGTNVANGYATGVVVTTGDRTYFGTLAQNIAGERPATSFDKGVNKTSWILIYFMLVMVPLVFLMNGFTKHDWHEAFFFALAVAVGLTPEMLPLIVTTNLAKGAISMSKKKVIVKKLNAIQNFGAMDIFCTDKTGTITENRVVLVRYLDTKGDESESVLRMAYLNSFFQTGLKNLIDQAVVESMEEKYAGDDERSYRKIDEVPFDFTRRRMSVVVEKEERIFICKGAVEEILKHCTSIEMGGKIVPIDSLTQQEATEMTRNLNSDGLRVVAVAYKKVPVEKKIYSVEDENELVLAGYIGFLDPPKESAKEAIKLLEAHGIQVKIITGDNEVVTARVCKDVELAGGTILLGSDIAVLTDEELAEKVETTTIFAKIEPMQKARIILALKSKGHTVGFMGDGINDAPAMRAADVGVSVDTAVDVAKEAADIILMKNDLHVLDSGVIEGRLVFGNILKYIKMTSSSNFGNMLSVLAASAFLPFLPMLPVQILIQNLLYDFSQISIPWDRMDEDFLKTPRKWEAGGITRFMFSIGPVSSLFDIVTFLVLWFVFAANVPEAQSFFQTGWFIEGLVSQTLIIHMIRTQKIPFIQSRATWPVIATTILIVSAGIIIPFTSIGASVGLTPLPMSYFFILIAILFDYALLTQIAKMLYIRKFKIWL